MKSVLCLTKYSDMGASSRVRIISNIESYKIYGFNFDLFPLLSNTYLKLLYNKKKLFSIFVFFGCLLRRYLFLILLLLGKKRYDIIYVEYEIFPYLPWFLERWFYNSAKKTIVELDDPIYLNYSKFRILRSKYLKIANRADHLIVSGRVMRDYFLSLNPTLSISILDTPVEFSLVDKNLVGKNIIGWIGSPTAQVYLIRILPSILPVIKEAGWILEVIGTSEDFLNHIPLIYMSNVIVIPWSVGVERDVLPRWSIGLLPLDSSDWTYARDCYKAHLYYAYQIYTIATKIPSTDDFVMKYTFGTTINDTQSWGCALEETIYNSPYKLYPKQNIHDSFYRQSYASNVTNVMKSLT